MKRSTIFWILAFIITAGSAVYQRMTGPTYPIKGVLDISGTTIHYSLPRSHGGETNCPVEILTEDQSISGIVDWKRYKTNDSWSTTVMTSQNGKLVAELPNQPPAGKLMYRVRLAKGLNTMTINNGDEVVVRFKGDVPWFVLYPHIIAMFIGMLLSTRAGFEVFNQGKNLRPLVYRTLALLFIGGFILGPLMQKFAFGEYWTGWPFGGDLTDNKTAVAVIAWLVAAIMLKRSEHPARWAALAAIITFVVFMIPHSVLGSELDYSKVDQQPVSSLYLSK